MKTTQCNYVVSVMPKEGLQGSKLLGLPMSVTPKNGDGNQILGSRFATWPKDNFKLGFSDRKPRNCWGNPNTEAGFPDGNPNCNRNFCPSGLA